MTSSIGPELRRGSQLKILVSWIKCCRFHCKSVESCECFPGAMLAQCDKQLVEQMVEYDGRKARTVLRLHSERKFGSQLTAPSQSGSGEMLWKTWKNPTLGSIFYLIRHDNFGGFRLFYIRDLEIPAKSILRDGSLGHLAAVPDEVLPVPTIFLTSKQRRGPYFDARFHSLSEFWLRPQLPKQIW